ncbi:MAG: O-antigen ligase family protein [Rickettsiaceae bacterium]|nr:MAG: O-antigen ligase family protein [Rickettsiaceae bacterium]
MNYSKLMILCIVLIPSLGMLSGLSCSFTVPLLLLILIKNSSPINFQISYKPYYLEIIFALWCFVSCFWSFNMTSSIALFILDISLIYLYYLSSINNVAFAINKNFTTSFTLGILVSIALFFLELKTNGFIYSNFRRYFQGTSFPVQYPLYSLDRGCALLAISSWPLFNILIVKHKYYLSYLLYLVILYTLYLSDSLASLLGFVASGAIFLLTQILPIRFFKYIRMLFLLFLVSLPIIAYYMNPYLISDHYAKILPESAKHRLFIWNFVSRKIASQPISGYGFSSSRQYIVAAEEVISYKNHLWSPLPIHPHNNVLQILFETGIIGFYLLLLVISKYLQKIEKLTITSRTTGSIYYACFINYFIIGMISFSALQPWWIAAAIWVIVMLKYSRDQSFKTA